jgi:putative hemolysin
MINKKIASELSVGLILLVALVIGGIFWLQGRNTYHQTQTKSEKTMPSGNKTNSAQLANPASVFCVQHGGKGEIRNNPDSSQTGYCIFENGKECEEWKFFRGECDEKIGSSK